MPLNIDARPDMKPPLDFCGAAFAPYPFAFDLADPRRIPIDDSTGAQASEFMAPLDLGFAMDIVFGAADIALPPKPPIDLNFGAADIALPPKPPNDIIAF